jgi:hypothetical protein
LSKTLAMGSWRSFQARSKRFAPLYGSRRASTTYAIIAPGRRLAAIDGYGAWGEEILLWMISEKPVRWRRERRRSIPDARETLLRLPDDHRNISRRPENDLSGQWSRWASNSEDKWPLCGPSKLGGRFDTYWRSCDRAVPKPNRKQQKSAYGRRAMNTHEQREQEYTL